MPPTQPPITSNDDLITVPVATTADVAAVVAAAQKLGERCGLAEPALSRLSAEAEDTARKLLRLGGDAMAIILRGSAGSASLQWIARNVRLPSEPSRTQSILTAAPTAKTIPPGTLAVAALQDPRVQAAGWRWPSAPGERVTQATVLERPHPRETHSGDVPFVERRGNKLRLAVVDGLGHGPAAREAAQRTVQALSGQIGLPLEEAVLRAHEQAAATRGATLGAVDIDLEEKLVRATTVGNIRVVLFFGAGRLWSPCGTDAVVGHGRGSFHGRLEVRVEQHPLPSDALFALFSDGLQNQLRLPWQRASELEDLALQLFSTYAVASDDATLLLLS